MLAKTRQQAQESGDLAQTRHLINHVATALFWALLLLTIAGVVFAPQLVTLVASGLTHDPETYASAVWMTRVMFPYIYWFRSSPERRHSEYLAKICDPGDHAGIAELKHDRRGLATGRLV